MPPRLRETQSCRKVSFWRYRNASNANWYPTVEIAFVDGDKNEVAGFGKLDEGKPPNGHTVYEIGSIAKTFTAAFLKDAIKSGRVSLETAVETLLPGVKIPARNGKRITLEDFSTQSSGLPYMPDNLAPADRAKPFADYDSAMLKSFLGAQELKRNPGAAPRLRM